MKCPLSTKLFLVAGKCSTQQFQDKVMKKKFSLLQKSWLDLYNYIQVIRNKLEVPQVSQDYE